MIGRLCAAAVAVGAIAVFGGCGSGEEGPRTVTVTITNSGYVPERLRIETGDRVTFVNRARTTQSAIDESEGDIDPSPGPGPTKHDGSLVNHASKRGFGTHSLFSDERQTVVFDVPRLYRYRSAFSPVHLGAIEVVDDLSDPEVSQTSLEVTRDFGRRSLASDRVGLLGNGTVMRQLSARHDVALEPPADEFVEAIDGLKQDPSPADDTLWVTNVNGIETDVLPSDYDLYAGDVVQWDLRDWFVRLDVRATVGAFPETFQQGVFGVRFPVTLVCERRASAACKDVEAALDAAGVPSDGTPPPRSWPPRDGNPQRARILVGSWDRWRDGRWASWIDSGPERSGVFARFSPDGRALRLLDWNGRPAGSMGPGTGLVAALRPTEEDLLWVVTGVDDEGVARAAAALGSPDLRNAFAAAVGDDGVEKLPLPPAQEAR